MASKTIKGLTVEIGGDTTKLGKALDKVNSQSKNLTGELRDINRMLKLDPTNTELLAQKQKVLSNAVQDTSKKLDILKEAEEQVQKQFEKGEVSEAQVRELQREIIATTQQLEKYEKAAKETADALDRLGDESDGAGKEIDDVADSADKAEKETEELGSSLDGTLSTGLKAVAGLAVAAAGAIVGCVEASHEYRTEMGKLDVAFQDSGHSGEAAKDTYKELQSVLGETDQAVEAANHLAKLADNETELNELTDALIGVYATFGASLPVESLAEAANETAKVGQVTGSFADAINWAADEGTDWKKVLGHNKKAMEAFEKATAEGEKTEDAYTAALEACSDEQERQELITKTLTKLYGKAADQYKKTNKQVIEANKANEDWNETLAELGEEMSPVITEVKKFGTELLKKAKEPLKDVADFLGNKVLPALSKLADWVSKNTPIIKAALAGVAAALVTYKVATIAAEVAQKGLKGALLATEAAQKLVNIAMAATPWGLAAVAIGGVVTALAVYMSSTDDTRKQVEFLTEKEKELMSAANEAADAFRDQQKATTDTENSIGAQMGRVQDLANELQTLADKSGNVKDADKARVDFILGELNEALGTEYTMTDNVIQKYDELTQSINEVILAKTANALLEANNAAYIEALSQKQTALQNVTLAEKDWSAQRQLTEDKEAELLRLKEEYNRKWTNSYSDQRSEERKEEEATIRGKELAFEQEKKVLAEKETAYTDAATDYGNYAQTIQDYDDATALIIDGNYQDAIDILTDKGAAFFEYSDDVDEATSKAVDALFQEAVDAGLAAEDTKKKFEAGVDGYTQEMVDEAEQGYDDALAEWATAYADAEGVGGDLGDGLLDGMNSKVGSLLSKARNIVNQIIGAMRKEADSHSPSRKMIDFGEDMGEGAEIGIEDSTKDILKTARKQVQGILSTYRDEGEADAPRVFRSINDRAVARNTETMQSFYSGNASKLDKILAVLKEGQFIVLDGDLVVGGTASRMDSKLGQLRVLAARGAR